MQFNAIIEKDEYGYFAYVPALKGCVSQGDTFEETIKKPNISLEEAIENIDIGGPTMIRAAAKNYNSVGVVTTPSQYQLVLEELKKNDGSRSLNPPYNGIKYTPKGISIIKNEAKYTVKRVIDEYFEHENNYGTIIQYNSF